MEVNCKTCNRTFTTIPSRPQKYCSPACMGADPDFRAKVSAGKKGEWITKNCEVCGAEFSVPAAKAARRRHCSRSCRAKNPTITANLHRDKRITVPCARCGKAVTRPISQVLQTVYCSEQCMANPVEVSCEVCGKVFTKRPSQVFDHNFCSAACRDRREEKPTLTCEWCGREFQKGRDQIRRTRHHFCSKTCSDNWFSLSEDSDAVVFRDKKRERWATLRNDPMFIQKMEDGWGSCRKANKLEEYVGRHFPELHYVGDGKVWVTLRDGRRKCPDFKVTGKRKFVEVWGNFWHKNEDPQELIDAYAGIGFECVVVWESEIRQDWEEVSNRIYYFIRMD
jgi:endogenous inhibitor of DNA gyrase (YacG/DUF329 family)